MLPMAVRTAASAEARISEGFESAAAKRTRDAARRVKGGAEQMPVELNALLHQCRQTIEKNTGTGTVGGAIRQPARPMLVTVLGSHPDGGLDRFTHTICNGWPTAGDRILQQNLICRKAEEFRAAVEDEDEEEETAFVRAVRHARSGTFKKRDLLLVFLLNFNDGDAEEVLTLLDQQGRSMTDGRSSRLLFAVGRTSSKRGLRRSRDFLKRLLEKAKENPGAWARTSCVVLSDCQYDGGTLDDEAFEDNYVLAADILLTQCSIDSGNDRNFHVPHLPAVTDPAKPFLTASLYHHKKPAADIARALFYGYFDYCMHEAERGGGAVLSNEALTREAEEACSGLFAEIKARFPERPDGDLWAFPGEAACAADVEVGHDRTFGIWNSFCSRYFLAPVRQACSQEQAVRWFVHFFSAEKGHTCREFASFGGFADHLDQIQDAFWPADASDERNTKLYDQGVRQAQCLCRRLILKPLRQAVLRLNEDALTYGNRLAQLRAQCTPYDNTVRDAYAPAAVRCIDQNPDMQQAARCPCGEDELTERLKQFAAAAVNESEVRDTFLKDLERRLGSMEAGKAVADLIWRGPETMANNARLQAAFVSGLPNSNVLMFDTARMGDIDAPVIFDLCGIDGMERIALYSFTAGEYVDLDDMI